MRIDRIAFAKSDDDQLTVTLRGVPAVIIDMLVHGLPIEELVRIHDALGAELRRRAAAPEEK